jgi:flavin reductase (DIM6/NTAB) family NADH-FMN oxidoreductase RutF
MQMEFVRLGEEPSRDLLRRVYGLFPTGVAALCALVDGKPDGMTVSSFTPVSLEPPLVCVSIQESSSTLPRLRPSPRLGISVLGASHEYTGRALSIKQGDRFRGLDWTVGSAGAVFICGASAWLECTIAREIPVGDHVMVVLAIVALAAAPAVDPLVFHASTYRRLEMSTEIVPGIGHE